MMTNRLMNTRLFALALGAGVLQCLQLAAYAAPAPSVKTTTWVADLANGGTGTVEFLAIGKPSALKIHGKGKDLKGHFSVKDGNVTGQAAFPLESVDTGIAMRDRHLKEKYLELSKYPEATLQITKLNLPQPAPAGDFKFEGVPFEGPLTLHGKTHAVSGTATIARAGSQMLVQAEFGLKISDYAIEIPSFAGITVADEVKVDVHMESPLAVAVSK